MQFRAISYALLLLDARGSCRELDAARALDEQQACADRDGAFGWSAPTRSCFVSISRRYASSASISSAAGSTRRCWCGETDPSLREDELGAAFADVWCAIPKVVRRSLDSVQGNARLAGASVAEEAAAALDATDRDVSVGGAGLAAQAIELGLVDELRTFRYPVVSQHLHRARAVGFDPEGRLVMTRGLARPGRIAG